jgi:hypothetical protein
VNTLVVIGTTIYAGGDFLNIGGQGAPAGSRREQHHRRRHHLEHERERLGSRARGERHHDLRGGAFRERRRAEAQPIAALDARPAPPRPGNPNANGPVQALVRAPARCTPRVPSTTSAAEARPDRGARCNDRRRHGVESERERPVVALVVARGTCTRAARSPRSAVCRARNIAALDTGAGAATAWNSGASGPVSSLVASRSRVYAGGQFTSIGGKPRGYNRRARYRDRRSHRLEPGPPTASSKRSRSTAMSCTRADASPESVGMSRLRIAAIDTQSGAVTTWNPVANGVVRALAVGGGAGLRGGQFSTMGGGPHKRVAAINCLTGAPCNGSRTRAATASPRCWRWR